MSTGWAKTTTTVDEGSLPPPFTPGLEALFLLPVARALDANRCQTTAYNLYQIYRSAVASQVLFFRTGDEKVSDVNHDCDTRRSFSYGNLCILGASMTTYATRSPLQLLTNSHIMGDTRRTTRRTSARIAEKEDMPTISGSGQLMEKGKNVHVNGALVKHGKAGINGAGSTIGKVRGKRKIGGCFSCTDTMAYCSDCRMVSRAVDGKV